MTNIVPDEQNFNRLLSNLCSFLARVSEARFNLAESANRLKSEGVLRQRKLIGSNFSRYLPRYCTRKPDGDLKIKIMLLLTKIAEQF